MYDSLVGAIISSRIPFSRNENLAYTTIGIFNLGTNKEEVDGTRPSSAIRAFSI
jgi:hypothetical protein